MKTLQGFVYSMTKNRKRFEELHNIVRFIGRWIIENMIIEKVSEFLDSQNEIKVFCRDIGENPHLSLKHILDFLALMRSLAWVRNFRKAEHHVISSNMVKFEQEGVVFDEKWRGVRYFSKMFH